MPPGQGKVWNMAPGRSAALKMLNGDTADSVMMFEEVAPASTETPLHTHDDSDEVAYVLSGQITFKIGDEITVGGPNLRIHAARTRARLEKYRCRTWARFIPLFTWPCRKVF